VHDGVRSEEYMKIGVGMRYSKLVPLGEGIVPLREIMGALKEDGYNGHLSFEYRLDQGEPEKTLPKYISTLRDV